MLDAECVQVAGLFSVVVLQPHDACNAVDSVGDVGRLATSEFFATATHGYNSRERVAPCGEFRRARTTAMWASLRCVPHGDVRLTGSKAFGGRCGPRSHDFYDVNVALFRLS